MFWFISYCIGMSVTAGVIFGGNAYAREIGVDEPFDWGTEYRDGPKVKLITAMCIWPIAWVTYGVSSSFRAIGRKHRRRIEAAKERQRLLDAPIPD